MAIFSTCLGDIDGSHIYFLSPAFYQAAYQNQKKFLSQNCLFICSFDLILTYALTGWEGSAADSQVYHNSVNTDLVIPEEWYYLADAGFPHCVWYGKCGLIGRAKLLNNPEFICSS
jgi:hypothetical protein